MPLKTFSRYFFILPINYEGNHESYTENYSRTTDV